MIRRFAALLLVLWAAGCADRPAGQVSCPAGQILHADMVAGAATFRCEDDITIRKEH